jgi:hypothetical protein
MRNIQDGFSQQCLNLSWRANSPFLAIVVARVRLSRNRGETVQVGVCRPSNVSLLCQKFESGIVASFRQSRYPTEKTVTTQLLCS